MNWVKKREREILERRNFQRHVNYYQWNAFVVTRLMMFVVITKEKTARQWKCYKQLIVRGERVWAFFGFCWSKVAEKYKFSLSLDDNIEVTWRKINPTDPRINLIDRREEFIRNQIFNLILPLISASSSYLRYQYGYYVGYSTSNFIYRWFYAFYILQQLKSSHNGITTIYSTKESP